MKNVIVALCILGLLAPGVIAIAAEDNPCKLIKTNSIQGKEGVFYYLNPKHISHLVMATDNIKAGTTPRLMLIVVMSNGDNILFGRFTNQEYRNNAKNYISRKIFKCGQ